jgi:4-hydroxy-tetrahydrodipicolinate reductase
MVRIAINGILGRMGQELTAAIMKQDGFILVGGTDTLETFYSEEICVSTDPEEILPDAELVIDFSSGEGTAAIAEACLKKSLPFITGTTGLSKEQQAIVMKLSTKVPVVQAFNFSLGINLLINLLQNAAGVLNENFDGEIIDIHHRNKKDSPSGTALLLAKTLANSLGLSGDNVQFGRHGDKLERGPEITLHSLRGGSVIGEHQVHLLCNHETIVLTHKALSRCAFVDGVLRAARWITSQKPGYYTMQDVLKLKI